MKLDLSEYYDDSEKLFSISYKQLTKSLVNDGAIFDSKIIKYFDDKQQGWVKLQNGKNLEYNKVRENAIYYILLKEPSIDQQIEEQNILKQKKNVQDLTKAINGIQIPLEKQNDSLIQIKHEIQKLQINPPVYNFPNINQPYNHNYLAPTQLSYDINNNVISNRERKKSHQIIELNPDSYNTNSNNKMGQSSANGKLKNPMQAANPNQVMSFNQYNTDKNIDIGILYSDPLDPEKVQGDPVNFEKEIKKLKENLQNTGKQLTMKIDVATYKKMYQMALQQPKVLHFICHGSYSEKLQQYFLHLETDDAKLFQCTKKEISDIKNVMKNIKLVFVNACHSQEVAKVFHEAGIPYVVAVQSNLKIEEEMAQEFSTNFYTSIFSGQEVQKAFELAKNMSKNIRGDNCYTCCCAHEHAKNCKWKLKCNGDCSKHTPSSDCDCPKKNELIHKFSFDEQCRWAKSFIEELDLYTSEELDEIMLDEEEINVCCCKDATKEIKHDESMKFQLMVNDKTGLEAIIFDNVPTGEIDDISRWRAELNYFWKPLHLNKKILRKIYDLLHQQNIHIIEVFGHQGIGKTTICEYAGHYIQERGMFKHGVLTINFTPLNLNNTKKLKQHMMMEITECQNLETMYQVLQYMDKLLILDNCGEIIKEDRENFKQFLSEIVEKTHIKLIITTNKGIGQNLQLNNYAKVELQQLEDKKACELLINSLPNEKIKSICSSQTQEKKILRIVQIMKKYPKDIIGLAKYINTIDDLNKTKDKLESDPFHKLEELYRHNIEGFKLLLIISFYPNGLTNIDFEIMEQIGILKKSWIQDIYKLVQKEPEEPIDILQLQDRDYYYLQISELEIKKDFKVKVFRTEFFNDKDYAEYKIPGITEIQQNIFKYNAYFCKNIYKMNPKLYIQHTQLSYSLVWNYKYSRDNQEQFDLMHGSIRDSFPNIQRIMDKQSKQDQIMQISQKFAQKFREVLKKYGKKAQQLYNHLHEKNFYVILTSGKLNDYIDQLNSSQISAKIYIEAMCQYMPQIFYAQDKKSVYDLSNIFGDEDTTNQQGLELVKNGLNLIDKQISLSDLRNDSNQSKQNSNLQIIKYKYKILMAKFMLNIKVMSKRWEKLSPIYKDLEVAIIEFKKKERFCLEIEARLQITEIAIKGFQKLEQVQKIEQLLKVKDKHFNIFQKIGDSLLNTKNILSRGHSSYKGILNDLFLQSNKEIFVRFGQATKESFLKTLEKGSTLLQLDLYNQDEFDYFQLEDQSLPVSQNLSFKELEDHFLQKEHNLANIQVFILSCNNGLPFVNYFKQLQEKISKNKKHSSYSGQSDLQLPYFIYFEYKSQLMEDVNMEKSIRLRGSLDDVITFVQRLSMQYFSVKFIKNLIDGQSLINAFQKARNSMIEKFVEIYNNYITNESQFEQIIGTGPILYQKSDPKCAQFKIKLVKDGTFQNISGNYSPTNIKQSYLAQSIIGRNKEFYTIMQKLIQKKTINIYGSKGVGKSDFVLNLGHQLVKKNHFPDGVYFFSLNELLVVEDFQQDLKKLMSESLGENFESKITSFFTYKMCFIIDDFDECFNSDLKIKNFSYIMDPLIKSECGLIIVTKRPFDEFKNEQSGGINAINNQELFLNMFKNKGKVQKEIEKYELPPLSVQDCHELLEQIINNNLLFVDQNQKNKVIPKISEFILKQEEKGNLQAMIDKFVEVFRQQLDIDIQSNPNPYYKLFGVDPFSSNPDSIQDTQLSQYPSLNTYLSRKYSSNPQITLIDQKESHFLDQIDEEDHKDQIRKLIEIGDAENLYEQMTLYNLNLKDDISNKNQKNNVFHYACISNKPLIVDKLLDILQESKDYEKDKISINQKNSNGKTPLMLACETGSEQVIDIIVEAMPEVLLSTDDQGLSLIDIAKKQNNITIIFKLEGLNEQFKKEFKKNQQQSDQNKRNHFIISPSNQQRESINFDLDNYRNSIAIDPTEFIKLQEKQNSEREQHKQNNIKLTLKNSNSANELQFENNNLLANNKQTVQKNQNKNQNQFFKYSNDGSDQAQRFSGNLNNNQLQNLFNDVQTTQCKSEEVMVSDNEFFKQDIENQENSNDNNKFIKNKEKNRRLTEDIKDLTSLLSHQFDDDNEENNQNKYQKDKIKYYLQGDVDGNDNNSNDIKKINKNNENKEEENEEEEQDMTKNIIKHKKNNINEEQEKSSPLNLVEQKNSYDFNSFFQQEPLIKINRIDSGKFNNNTQQNTLNHHNSYPDGLNEINNKIQVKQSSSNQDIDFYHNQVYQKSGQSNTDDFSQNKQDSQKPMIKNQSSEEYLDKLFPEFKKSKKSKISQQDDSLEDENLSLQEGQNQENRNKKKSDKEHKKKKSQKKEKKEKKHKKDKEKQNNKKISNKDQNNDEKNILNSIHIEQIPEQPEIKFDQLKPPQLGQEFVNPFDKGISQEEISVDFDRKMSETNLSTQQDENNNENIQNSQNIHNKFYFEKTPKKYLKENKQSSSNSQNNDIDQNIENLGLDQNLDGSQTDNLISNQMIQLKSQKTKDFSTNELFNFDNIQESQNIKLDVDQIKEEQTNEDQITKNLTESTNLQIPFLLENDKNKIPNNKITFGSSSKLKQQQQQLQQNTDPNQPVLGQFKSLKNFTENEGNDLFNPQNVNCTSSLEIKNNNDENDLKIADLVGQINQNETELKVKDKYQNMENNSNNLQHLDNLLNVQNNQNLNNQQQQIAGIQNKNIQMKNNQEQQQDNKKQLDQLLCSVELGLGLDQSKDNLDTSLLNHLQGLQQNANQYQQQNNQHLDQIQLSNSYGKIDLNSLQQIQQIMKKEKAEKNNKENIQQEENKKSDDSKSSDFNNFNTNEIQFQDLDLQNSQIKLTNSQFNFKIDSSIVLQQGENHGEISGLDFLDNDKNINMGNSTNLEDQKLQENDMNSLYNDNLYQNNNNKLFHSISENEQPVVQSHNYNILNSMNKIRRQITERDTEEEEDITDRKMDDFLKNSNDNNENFKGEEIIEEEMEENKQ